MSRLIPVWRRWGVLVLAAAVAVTVSCDTKTETLAEVEPTDRAALHEATAIVLSFHAEYGELPDAEHGQHLITEWKDIRDRWGQQLQYAVLDDERFQIRSSGPDAVFGTDDDLLDTPFVDRATAAGPEQPERQPEPEQPEPPEQPDEPFSLKGDEMGMSLRDFKSKYRRLVEPKYGKYAPFCSDENPGKEIDTVLAEAWHADAGIVTCSPVFPFEISTDPDKAPTVAGVKTSRLIYHFVDDYLFKITVWFPQSGHSRVRRGLEAKWGPPTSESRETYQNAMGATFIGLLSVWKNDVSSIMLVERSGSVRSSMLLYFDSELFEVATKREPQPSGDDL